MNFTKNMIDLVREIRRRSSSDDKPGIKLANPELLEELISVFQSTQDAVMKALIKELFFVAGGGWSERLVAQPARAEGSHQSPSQDPNQPKKIYITKTYRGQTQLMEVTSPAENSTGTQKIYRGQPVTS